MKKYLNTPEEVIKALKDGKEVKDLSSWTYKLIGNGIIVGSSSHTPWQINPTLAESDKPYIEEAEPLKFEVGKFYKTRSGKKVLFCFERESGTYPLHFISQENGRGIFLTKKGTTLCSEETDDLDIIGEWEEE